MHWLSRYLDPVTLTCILRSSDFDTFCVDVRYLLNYKANNYQTLQSSSFNVLTQQIPWPGDLDLYFGCSDFDKAYVNVPDLLKCKTSNYQTLHSASPRCTDSAGNLTRWHWPIFCAPVPFTHFTSTFSISSTIRPTTNKPCIVLLLNVRTLQVPWFDDLDLYFALHWLLHLLSSTIRPSTTKPCIVLLTVLIWQVPWPGDLDLYFALQWLWHILYWCSLSPQI